MLPIKISKGVVACTNEATRNALVQESLQRFRERNLEMDEEETIYCCRLFVGDGDPKLIIFLLYYGENSELEATMMLWSEAEETGIATELLAIIDKGDYQAGPGRRLYPGKVPMGEKSQ